MIFSLLLAGIFMVMPTYMDQLTALGFSPEEMRIWVYRVVVPTYFLTIAYFSYRYLSGKNPTSTVWPILIVTFFFLISQIVGFVTTELGGVLHKDQGRYLHFVCTSKLFKFKDDLEVNFPENYQKADLSGKPATFKVIIKDILEAEKSKINDELATRMGLPDLKSLKEAIKNQIEINLCLENFYTMLFQRLIKTYELYSYK